MNLHPTIKNREDLPQFFVDKGYKIGAEIGVYKGWFSQKLCNVGLKLYAIDPWRNYDDFSNSRGQARLDFLYEHTQRVLAPYPGCKIIRKTSMEALVDFADDSLDFVYIDANHDFRYIAEDLVEWTKKVRPGGVVSGHDYSYIKSDTGEERKHVGYVLQAYMTTYKIPSWYLLGREQPQSWMFTKP